jgi:hypothetical protein
MRVGDFAVDLIAIRDGDVREIESGHVLARPGTVYAIRLRNFGPLRAVADVQIDGKVVTGRGILVDAYGVATLERPVDAAANGRFTVIAEGDERVFGPDGGRDNDALGAIEVSFRRELPRAAYRHPSFESDSPTVPTLPTMPHDPFDAPDFPTPPGRPMAPPGWTPPTFSMMSRSGRDAASIAAASPSVDVRHPPHAPSHLSPQMPHASPHLIERAAGTGLTGASTQHFEPIAIGPLEENATVIRLRLAIGTDEAFDAPRPLPDAERVPARPPARP